MPLPNKKEDKELEVLKEAVALFGFSIGKEYPVRHYGKEKELFTPPNSYDGTEISVGGVYGTFLDLNVQAKNNLENINRYREMAMTPECSKVIAEITCESIVQEGFKDPVRLSLDQLEKFTTGEKVSDDFKEQILEEFKFILRLLNFKYKGYEIFKNWYIDGKLYYHLVIEKENPREGIVELQWLDPTKISKKRIVKKANNAQGIEIIDGYYDFYVYNEMLNQNPNINVGSYVVQAVRISTDSIVYVDSGLFDRKKKMTISYLHEAIRPLNMLRNIEDSLIVFKVSRAPNRRIFKIDVGGMTRPKAEQAVQNLINKYRQKLVFDSSTGQMSSEKQFLSMMEDYWIPYRGDGTSKGVEIDTLDSTGNFAEVDEINYFKEALYNSLKVPLGRIRQDNPFVSAKGGAQISQEEIRFAQFINKLRIDFSEIFSLLLKRQLILKGIVNEDEWQEIQPFLHFIWSRLSYYEETEQLAVITDRAQAVTMLQPLINIFYSRQWISTNVLKLTEEEQEEMKKQIAEEAKEAPPLSMDLQNQVQAQQEIGSTQADTQMDMMKAQSQIGAEDQMRQAEIQKDVISHQASAMPKSAPAAKK